MRRTLGFMPVAFLQGKGECECAADTRVAFHPDAAPQHLHEFLADGQPQPGPALIARLPGGYLLEHLEQPALIFGFDPDAGVGNAGYKAAAIDMALDANVPFGP